MEVEITPELRELAAKIQGPVDRRVTGNPNCGANVGSGNMTDIVCVFKDVDFVRGGRYRAEDHPPEIEDGKQHQSRDVHDGPPASRQVTFRAAVVAVAIIALLATGLWAWSAETILTLSPELSLPAPKAGLPGPTSPRAKAK